MRLEAENFIGNIYNRIYIYIIAKILEVIMRKNIDNDLFFLVISLIYLTIHIILIEA